MATRLFGRPQPSPWRGGAVLHRSLPSPEAAAIGAQARGRKRARPAAAPAAAAVAAAPSESKRKCCCLRRTEQNRATERWQNNMARELRRLAASRRRHRCVGLSACLSSQSQKRMANFNGRSRQSKASRPVGLPVICCSKSSVELATCLRPAGRAPPPTSRSVSLPARSTTGRPQTGATG